MPFLVFDNDDDAEGQDPNPSTHSISWVGNVGPKPIPFWARNLAHDDDFLCFANVCVVLEIPTCGQIRIGPTLPI